MCPPYVGTCFEIQAAQKKANKDDIKSLKDKQKVLKKEISNTDKKLSETRKNTKQSLHELDRLNADVEYRDMMISRRSKEISDITDQIDSLNSNIKTLSKQYDGMRKKYADMIYYAYMTKSQQDKLLYVLSSKSFQEGYRRFQYLASLAEMRKEQSVALSNTKRDIQAKRDKMNLLKVKTQELLKKQEQEKEFALIQKQKQNRLIASLQTREKELKEELRRQQVSADKLNLKIQDMIAKQAAAEAERRKKMQQQKKNQAIVKKSTPNSNAQKKAPPQSTPTTAYALSNEEKNIAGGFAKNKGLLMWPVKGTITGKFGKQQHPAFKDVIVNNKGIYITSTPGAKAMSVYDGVVSQCFSVPGGNNAVIVRHGNYLTVYANLTQIFVKNGDKIKRNSPIGKIYSDKDNANKTTLFFQIWQEKTLLNPQLWLHK